jgi:formate hydrogenlyase subunit 3/multisubunit Na+/H+ antiporter MnhD subunit
MVGFYLFFTIASLAAYGLTVFEETAEAKRAASLYVGLAILGEAILLMALVLLAQSVPNDSSLISDAVGSLAQSPWRGYTMAFLILAFGLKIGLFPFHVWMPLTYSAAPIAAAAVLSGSAVKVGVIGLIRFLPFETGMPGWGEALAIAGVFSAYYGVLVGITQTNPKAILAYSSVSQMGLLAAVLGMGLSAGDQSAPPVAAFSAMIHVLVKGGLFLALGLVATTKRGIWLVLVPAAVLALGLGGLPLTGGALAKIACKAGARERSHRRIRFTRSRRKHALDASFSASDVGTDSRGRRAGSAHGVARDRGCRNCFSVGAVFGRCGRTASRSISTQRDLGGAVACCARRTPKPRSLALG